MRDWGCLLVLCLPPPPHNCLPEHLDLGQIFLDLVNKIVRDGPNTTTTTVEDFIHSFGVYTEGLEVVCNISHVALMAIQALIPHESPPTVTCRWGLPGPAFGCVGRKEANPPLQRLSTITGG